MTIYRDPRGGSLLIERRLHGARFRRATGLRDTPTGRATAEKYDAMLSTLLDGGRADIVDALATGALDFADVWPHYRTGAWSRIPSAEHLKPLYAAVEAWLPKACKVNGKPLSARHRADIGQAFKMLRGVKADATIADCPTLLREYRERCESRDIGRTFRRVKDAMSAFLRETQGKRRSLLWAECRDVPDLPYTRDVTLALPIARAWEIYEALPPVHAPVWWALCCSGMMPDELWGNKWKVARAGLVIGGTKTAFRLRTVPLLVTPGVPGRRYQAFCRALGKVAPGVTPYVARRTFSLLLEDADIHPTRRRLYMGHRATDPHGMYPEHDVTPHLEADGLKLRDTIIAGGGQCG